MTYFTHDKEVPVMVYIVYSRAAKQRVDYENEDNCIFSDHTGQDIIHESAEILCSQGLQTFLSNI